ncbi:hypothetical protein D3C78_1026270 [compost metagenome]
MAYRLALNPDVHVAEGNNRISGCVYSSIERILEHIVQCDNFGLTVNSQHVRMPRFFYAQRIYFSRRGRANPA